MSSYFTAKITGQIFCAIMIPYFFIFIFTHSRQGTLPTRVPILPRRQTYRQSDILSCSPSYVRAKFFKLYPMLGQKFSNSTLR